MIRASTPGKLVIAGAFVVLDGAPGVGLAVSPRLSLELSPGTPASWPSADPFARAALRSLGLDPDAPPPLAVRSAFPLPVARWSLGSSAAHATALVAALSRWSGRPLSGRDLFLAARDAHREAQGGVGSGLDVACCVHGGAVLLRGAEPRPLPWPDRLGAVVVRSTAAEGTADRVRAYLAVRDRAGDGPAARLVRAIECLIVALDAGEGILACLAEIGAMERDWSSAFPGLAPAVLPAVSAALAPMSARGIVAVKSLGAGDAVGVFLDRDEVSEGDVLEAMDRADLPARVVVPDLLGTTTEDSGGGS